MYFTRLGGCVENCFPVINTLAACSQSKLDSSLIICSLHNFKFKIGKFKENIFMMSGVQ